LTVLVGANRTDTDVHVNHKLVFLFIPIHIAYWAIIIMGAFNGWSGSARCTSRMVYPYIMISNDSLFGFVYLISLFLHWKGYFI
jgi:hypothetical protein